MALFLEGKLHELGWHSSDPVFKLKLPEPADGWKAAIAQLKPELENTPLAHKLWDVTCLNHLCLPLGTESVTIGFLTLFDKAGGFSQADLALAKEACGSISLIGNLFLQAARQEHMKVQASQALRESEQTLRTIEEDTQDALIIMQTDGLILKVNHAGARLLANSEVFLVENTNLTQYLLNTEDLETLIGIIRSGRDVQDFELIFNRGLEQVYTTVSATPIYHNGQDFEKVHLILRDITERVLRAQELMQANLDLIDLNHKLQISSMHLFQQEKLASIGQLAAGIAHEINNPLAFVLSNFNSLKKITNALNDRLSAEEKVEYGEELQEIAAICTESEEGFERITKIVRSLKTFSRIDHEDGSTTKVDINEALKTTLIVAQNEYRYVADVVTDFAPEMEIECFPDQMNQVFLNLVVNAAQAIKGQKRDDRGTITLSTKSFPQEVQIFITDNGPGIPEHILPRIFEPFFTTKDIGEGTGLGLSISRDIVINKHGGRLEVQSKTGAGSTFCITLPRTLSEHNRAGKENIELQSDTSATNGNVA